MIQSWQTVGLAWQGKERSLTSNMFLRILKIFCSWTALGIKVRRARSIHAPIICFESCLYMVCYVIINKNNDKRKKKREILGRGGSFLNCYNILWRKKKSHFRKLVAFAWWNLEYSIKTINFFINALLFMMFIIHSSKKLYCTTARAKYQLLSSWPTKYLLLKS